MFDVVIESFPDDLGVNLEPAREMGMATTKVSDPLEALAALATILGFRLSSPR